MTKAEKVIKALELCTSEIETRTQIPCETCPYHNRKYHGVLGDGCCNTLSLLGDIKAIFYRLAEVSNGGWISVEDRLPDNKDRYLCACFDYVTKTYWIDILWHVSGRWWARLSTMGADKDYNDHVRYWTYLPELPKEEKDDAE